MTTCETKNDNESMPTEMMAVEPKQEPNAVKLEAKKEKMRITDDDDQMIQCAALMYGDAQDVDTEASGVFEVSANDNLYVMLLSFEHKVAAIYEYSADEEDDDTNTMRRVSEDYFR